MVSDFGFGIGGGGAFALVGGKGGGPDFRGGPPAGPGGGGAEPELAGEGGGGGAFSSAASINNSGISSGPAANLGFLGSGSINLSVGRNSCCSKGLLSTEITFLVEFFFPKSVFSQAASSSSTSCLIDGCLSLGFLESALATTASTSGGKSTAGFTVFIRGGCSVTVLYISFVRSGATKGRLPVNISKRITAMEYRSERKSSSKP